MNKRIVLYIIIALFTLTVFIILSQKYYLGKVKFYQPVSITLKGLSTKDFHSVECWASGPVRDKIVFDIDSAACSFYGKYAFRKDIFLEIPENLIPEVTEIQFISGENLLHLSTEQLKQKSVHGKNFRGTPVARINFSELVSQNNSTFSMLISIYYWGTFSRLIILLGIIIIVVFSASLFIYKKKPLLIEKLSSKMKQFLTFIFSEKLVNKKFQWATIALLLILFSFIYFSRSSFTNGAIFQWSDHLYQSAGVNFAKGHGISRIGAIEPFDNYKFTEYGTNLEFNYRLFTRFPGAYFFHNPPGYGLFIGMIYYVFGVNPFWLKCIQLLLLILVASLLPYVGFSLWKTRGFWSGVLASFLFIGQYYNMANNMHPQCLLLFMCFLTTLLFIRYQKTQSILILILFGIIAGFAGLVVISLLLLPFLVFLYFIYFAIKQRSLKPFNRLLIFAFCFLIPVFAWSFYASTHNNTEVLHGCTYEKMKYELFESPLSSNDSTFLYPLIAKNPKINDLKMYYRDGGYVQRLDIHNIMAFELFGHSFFRTGFVLIATQTENNALFMAHNEYITKGDFNGDWSLNKSSFYNNDNLGNYPAWIRVLNFYYYHPSKIITLPLQKLYTGFSPYRFLSVFMLVFIMNSLLILTRREKTFSRSRKFVLFFLMNVLLLLPVLFTIPCWIYYIMMFLCLLILITNFFNKNKFSLFKIPAAFSLITLNLILLTILVSNNRLYTDVIDFIFILCGVFAVMHMNLKWIFPDVAPVNNIKLTADDIH
jgi:4-amino-4-deoxy-L-arabinose transferase-like glycosyltransferase